MENVGSEIVGGESADEEEILQSDPGLDSLPTGTKRKAPSTAFKPGRSGNPRGRPRSGYAVTEIFRDALDEQIGEDKKTKLRVIFDVLFKRFLEGETLASRIILERAYGNPLQDLSVTNPDGSLGGPRIVIEVPAKEVEEPEKLENQSKSVAESPRSQ